MNSKYLEILQKDKKNIIKWDKKISSREKNIIESEKKLIIRENSIKKLEN
jgi:hypothetical protein